MFSAASVLCSLSACATDSTTSNEQDPVDCSTQTADTFTVGLEKPGVNGAVDFKLMSINPAPAVRGNNTWIVQLASMASGVVGSPIDGAMVSASPFMPAHQHGSPITPEISATGTPGEYMITPINLWMPGVWQTTLTVTSGTADRAVFSFCVN
ncbi:hypothetical protein BH11MYX1_BH11MYX1_26850 [soil metagenome]